MTTPAMTSVIAIDGPAYVGKSSIARSLSQRMGFPFVNTGHMYRAIGKLGMDEGSMPESKESFIRLAQITDIRFEVRDGSCRTIVNGQDWTDALDDSKIVQMASKIAVIPEVRRLFTDKQRGYAQEQKVIMEGRDIGSVVFPDAIWKFFITASLEVRAKRMHKMLSKSGEGAYPDYGVLISKVKELDDADTKRSIAPLRIAKRAIVYDNSDSPTAVQDAIILQYYINHGEEIVRNADLLKT